jgi:hypothetical protein
MHPGSSTFGLTDVGRSEDTVVAGDDASMTG